MTCRQRHGESSHHIAQSLHTLSSIRGELLIGTLVCEEKKENEKKKKNPLLLEDDASGKDQRGVATT